MLSHSSGRRACLYGSKQREKKICGYIRRDVEVKPLHKTLAVKLAEVMAKKLSNTLDHVDAKALVNKFLATAAEMKVKTTAGTLPDLEAKALVEETVETQKDVKVRIMPIY